MRVLAAVRCAVGQDISIDESNGSPVECVAISSSARVELSYKLLVYLLVTLVLRTWTIACLMFPWTLPSFFPPIGRASAEFAAWITRMVTHYRALA